MLGSVARLIAYAKAPVATFVTIHPIRALKMAATYMVVKKALRH